MRIRRIFLVGLGVALSAIALGWVGIQAERAFRTSGIPHVDAWWTILALLAAFSASLVRGWRWWRMIDPHGPMIPPIQAFFASLATNNVVPLRTGDLLRIGLFCGARQHDTARAGAMLVAERIADCFCLAMFGCLVGGLLTSRPAATLMAALALAATLLVAMASIGSWLPKRWLDRPFLRRAADAAGSLRNLRSGTTLVGCGAVAWCLEALAVMAAMHACGLVAGFPAAILMMVLATFATLLPAAPGAIGTFEAAFVATGMGLALPMNQLTTAAVLAHFCILLPATAVGGLVLLRLGRQA